MFRHSLLALICLPALALAQVPPEKAVGTMTRRRRLAGRAVRRRADAHQPDQHRRRPQGPRLGVRGRQLPPQELRPADPPARKATASSSSNDNNGDGKADKSTVFYQGTDLYGPLGVCVAPYPDGNRASKVFVCQSPDILVFEDKDGDGKADGPPKKFLTGFGGFDHDHGVHGINIGPDGKLYFTVGDAGREGPAIERRQGPQVVTATTPTAGPAPSGAATWTARTSN